MFEVEVGARPKNIMSKVSDEKEKIDQISKELKEKLTLEGKKIVFEDLRELKSDNMKENAKPEEFTKEFLVRKVLFDVFNLKSLPEKIFSFPGGGRRSVDFQLENANGNKILVEVKPINANLFKKTSDGAVNQIKELFQQLIVVRDNYEFGVATDGLKWVFVDKKGNLLQKEGEELNIEKVKDFETIRDYLVGEEEVSSQNVEEISKEFYEKYNSFLHGGKGVSEKDCLVNNVLNVDIQEDKEQIAQTTINRLIFIRFLQSKKIIKDDVLGYLSKIEDPATLNGKLMMLFFRVLNTSNNERKNISDEFKKIPYLNGSLFTKTPVEEKYDYEIELNILKKVIEFLDKTAFTHKESETNRQAIDPEILGYIFERAMNSTDRKGTGAYYTPKTITKYISENTIYPCILDKVNDMLRKEKVENFRPLEEIDQIYSQSTSLDKIYEIVRDIRICDNACGSGAFLLASAKVLFKIYKKLDDATRKSNFDYGLKKLILKNNIYGVDLNPNAIEIAKLRLWLWLVDSYELDHPEPLPNIEYNLRTGNSLIGYNNIKRFEVSKELWDRLLPEHRKNIQSSYLWLSKRKEILSKYKEGGEDVKDLKMKIEYVDSIAKPLLNKEFVMEFILNEKQKKSEIEVSKAVEEFKKLKPFHWGFEFYDVFDPEKPAEKRGFDVVIGNPPYIKEYTNKKAFDGIRKSPYYKGKMDLWYLFTCKGIDLLKEKGILGYIAQNNWVTSYGASIMRNKVMRETKMLNLIDFGDYKIFQDVGIQTMIMIFKKENVDDNYVLDYRKLNYSKGIIFQEVLDILSKNKNDQIEYLTPKINREKYIDKPITFGNKKVEELLDKILEEGNFKLDGKKEVAQGMVYPQDFLNKKNQQILGGDFKVGQGIFVLSNDEKNSIPFTEKELELIKPQYTTKELFKYYANPKNKLWVIYTDSSFRDVDKMKQYPNIKKHIDQFREVITSDNKPYGLHRTRDEKFFKGEKIISVRKCAEPTFTYTDFDCYVSATFYVIKSERINMKYLTALLNSKLVAFWLKYKGKIQGNNYQVDKEPLLNIPIKKPSEKEQKPFIELADKMLSLNKKLKETTDEKEKLKIKKELETTDDKIDEMVYGLYGLSEEEIRVVERGLK